MWHVHGAWATAFVNGFHDVVVPVLPDRGPDGRGLPTTYGWPDGVTELPPSELAAEAFDVVVLQRPEEVELLERWCGLRAGIDVPAVYVEHNSPRDHAATSRHPLAGQSVIPIVHVTHFNALMWDNGSARVDVIEHGIPDPGLRYTGMLPRVGYVVNEPVRRGRITGTDLIGRVATVAPVDAFGLGTVALTSSAHRHEVIGHGDVAHSAMLDMLAGRRVYAHLCRWTSLGLSLLEAMFLGMPVVALATTEAPEALAGSGAVVTNDMDRFQAAVRDHIHDPDAASDAGRRCRAHALTRFSLARFQTDWDRLLKEVL